MCYSKPWCSYKLGSYNKKKSVSTFQLSVRPSIRHKVVKTPLFSFPFLTFLDMREAKLLINDDLKRVSWTVCLSFSDNSEARNCDFFYGGALALANWISPYKFFFFSFKFFKLSSDPYIKVMSVCRLVGWSVGNANVF